MGRVRHVRLAILSLLTSTRTELDVSGVVDLVAPELLDPVRSMSSFYKDDGGERSTLKGDVQRALTWLSNAGYMRHEGPKQGGHWRLTPEGQKTPENRAARALQRRAR